MDWKEREKKMGKETAEAISSMINGGGRGAIEVFAKEVTTDHRTLQQGTFRAFIDCMRIWAEYEKNGNYDLRNEATCKLSKKIIELVENEPIPFI